MSSLLNRPLLVAAIVLSCAAAADAQQRPTPDQARILLQTRPDLVRLLQQRLAESGMSRDQIRARLRAEGYPEDLLDGYLPGSTGTPGALGQTEYAAVEKLGIADDATLDSLRLAMEQPPAPPRPPLTPSRCSAARMLGARPAPGAQPGASAERRPWYDERLRDTTHARPATEPFPAEGMDADSLCVFGADLFASQTSQFDPNAAGPVDPSYRLGPGDGLVLVLTGDVEAAYNLTVTRQGFIVVPQVGEINVANLTLGQLEDVLYSRLGRVYSGVRRGGGSTHFSISPSRLRTNQVYVVGDVAVPGSYRVSAAGTALTALYAAGGPTDIGTMRRVEIRRAGRTVDTLDVYDYLLRGDASHDPRLENGDVVFVGVRGPHVRVEGEVLRPAIYETRPGETLADVIGAAGGFRAEANRGRVQIERIVAPAQRLGPGRSRATIDIAAADLGAVGGVAMTMEDGDIVRVFPVADYVRHRVTVRGNVWTPGRVGFQPGMKLSDAIRLAGGLKPDTYLGRILVSRVREDSTHVQLRASLADTTGTVIGDFPLTDNDDIRIFAATEFRPTRYVTVLGAVRRSGRYPYRDGMTMRDLVLLAGGLEEKASLEAAEIARLPLDHSGGKLARTIRVPLDSTYVFDRREAGNVMLAGTSSESGGAATNHTAAAGDVPLEPYDNVLILEQPEWERQRTVTIVGEVRSPGTYSLTTKGDRLRDIIERAGGLTAEGNADGVVFVRDGVGRIGVDLPQVLRNGRARDNLLLKDRDSVYIPAYTGTVMVTGAVNAPLAVAFVPGADIDHYIAAAGGLASNANLKYAYVTQPNGKVETRKQRVFWPDGKPEPRPGSQVTVPAKGPNDRRDVTAYLTAAVQVLGSLVAITAILARN
jgi:polysaccharide export outer membrane protein